MKTYLYSRIICLLTVTMVVLCICSSCQSKEEKNVDSLRNIVESVETEGDEMSREEWDEVMGKYESILGKESYECKYTDEQLKEIGRLRGRFMAKATRIYAQKYGRKMIDLFKQAGSIFEGFVEGLTEDLNEEYEDGSLD